MIGIPLHMKTLVAAVRTAEIAAQIEAYCAATTDVAAEIRLATETVADAPALINGGADIVVVEAGPAADADLDALEQLCAYVARGGSFIVIMEDPTADIVRRLFRAGVTDVLPTPVTPAELAAALDVARGRQAQARPGAEPRPEGKIVTVLKTSGGVGATTFAVNVAAALAGLQKEPVCVVDLDVQFGQVATALDIHPRMTLLDVLRAGPRLDATLLASTLHQHKSGVRILSAPKDTTPLDAVADSFIAQLFGHLRAISGVALIELPAAWTQWTGDVLDRSDLVVPVAEASVRSAAGAARIAQSFVDFGLSRLTLHVVANKYVKTLENHDRMKKIAEIFHTKPDGAVRFDAAAAGDAADRGLLFAEAAPKSPATRDFETNARAIAGVIGLPLANRHRPEPAALEKLLGGRLGMKGRTP
jgi:pilus assembly protein CpaE